MLLLACLLAVTFCTDASAQTPDTALPGTAMPDPAQSNDSTPDSRDDTSPPPKFFWPTPVAKRCWAPGTTPQLSMTVLALIDAKAASDAWTQNPNLIFDGFW